MTFRIDAFDNQTAAKVRAHALQDGGWIVEVHHVEQLAFTDETRDPPRSTLLAGVWIVTAHR